MPNNDQSEYSAPSINERRLPDGRMRAVTQQERMKLLRSAVTRDQPLPPGVNPGVQVRP